MNSYAALPKEYQTCISCHGDKGQGNKQLSAPALAGMEAWYIERQLKNFKAGIRGNSPQDVLGSQMKAFAGMLDSEQIKRLASAISKLPVVNDKNLHSGDLDVGKKYYLSNCAACHGNQAQGNHNLNSPGISFLDAEYMKRQINHFINGTRGSHPEDKFGKQMAMMAKTLPNEKAIDDVIAFIKSLQAE